VIWFILKPLLSKLTSQKPSGKKYYKFNKANNQKRHLICT